MRNSVGSARSAADLGWDLGSGRRLLHAAPSRPISTAPARRRQCMRWRIGQPRRAPCSCACGQHRPDCLRAADNCPLKARPVSPYPRKPLIRNMNRMARFAPDWRDRYPGDTHPDEPGNSDPAPSGFWHRRRPGRVGEDRQRAAGDYNTGAVSWRNTSGGALARSLHPAGPASTQHLAMGGHRHFWRPRQTQRRCGDPASPWHPVVKVKQLAANETSRQ